MKDVDTLMGTVYALFSYSTVKRAKLKEIVKVFENEPLVFGHFALQAIIRNYEVLNAYFEKDTLNDPVVNYCYKKLNNVTFKIALFVLSDILEEIASLCKNVTKEQLETTKVS